MTSLLRQLCAGLFALALIAALLWLATLGHRIGSEPPAGMVLRDIQFYQPPPPPPPPPSAVRAADNSAGAPAALISEASALELNIMELDVQMPANDMGSLGHFGTGLAGLEEGLGLAWDTVGLAELDGQPVVLSAPHLAYPQALLDRGISEFSVEFHIIIDEAGRVFPVRLLDNPFSEQERALMEFAAQVRFSPPERLGLPVRAEYRWPVRFGGR